MWTIPDGQVKTFDDLFNDFLACRSALTHAGVDRAATVVSLVGNRPIFFPLFAACMDLGLALVAVGDATDAEAAALAGHARASAVVTDREFAPGWGTRTALTDGTMVLRLDDPADAVPYGESVVLKLTSGSTDVPKAAVASETHLVNDGRHIIEAMGIRATDVNFTCIPLSHSYAIGNIVMPLLWQGTGVGAATVVQSGAVRRGLSPAAARPYFPACRSCSIG